MFSFIMAVILSLYFISTNSFTADITWAKRLHCYNLVDYLVFFRFLLRMFHFFNLTYRRMKTSIKMAKEHNITCVKSCFICIIGNWVIIYAIYHLRFINFRLKSNSRMCYLLHTLRWRLSQFRPIHISHCTRAVSLLCDMYCDMISKHFFFNQYSPN